MTPTDVANRALAQVGARASITNLDTDATAPGVRLRLQYAGMKDGVLQRHPWSWKSVPDPALDTWPALAVTALVSMLAASVAFDVTGNADTPLQLFRLAEAHIAQAWAQDRQNVRRLTVQGDIFRRHQWSYFGITSDINTWPEILRRAYDTELDALSYMDMPDTVGQGQVLQKASEALIAQAWTQDRENARASTVLDDVFGRHPWAFTMSKGQVSTWPAVLRQAYFFMLDARSYMTKPETVTQGQALERQAEAQIAEAWAESQRLTRSAVVRDEILGRHDWAFARKRIALTPNAAVVSGWPYVYTMPPDCLVFRGIWNGCAWPSPPVLPFEQQGSLILTAVPGAEGIYTQRMSTTTAWPANIQQAFLAKVKAWDELDKTETASLGRVLMQQAEELIDRAWIADQPTMGHEIRTDFTPSWMQEGFCC